MKVTEINKPIKERGMPSSIIKHKQKLAMMTDKELADRFKDADEDKLRRMAWGHGYGKMSSHYLDRVRNHMTSKRTGTTEFDNPREIPVKPTTNMTPKEIGDRVEKAKARASKKPEPFDFSKLWSKEKDVTEYRNVVTPRDEAHYREMIKTLHDLELKSARDPETMAEIKRRKMELRNWAEQNLGEGFIGKKMEYNDFLQNKLDQAIQEYDTPEKKAERDALMKQYLAKGGSVEKVPFGKKTKDIKAITRPDPDNPEPEVKESPIEQDHNNPIAKPYVDMPEWKALHDMDDKIVQAYIKHKEVKEEAPFEGLSLVRMALTKDFITADEWFHLKDEWKQAHQELEQRYDDWPDGEGFGSSDHNFAIKELMELVGYEFDEQDKSGSFIVTKMPERLEKMGLKNARMRKEPVARDDHRELSRIAKYDDVNSNATEDAQADEDKIKQWAEKYRQYKNLEDDNLVKALYDFAFDLGITQFIFDINELKAAEEK
jgi:hypothetical protein